MIEYLPPGTTLRAQEKKEPFFKYLTLEPKSTTSLVAALSKEQPDESHASMVGPSFG